MTLLDQLPHFSQYDPGTEGDASLDPLGLPTVASRIVQHLVTAQFHKEGPQTGGRHHRGILVRYPGCRGRHTTPGPRDLTIPPAKRGNVEPRADDANHVLALDLQSGRRDSAAAIMSTVRAHLGRWGQ